MTKLIKILAAVAPDSRALARSRHGSAIACDLRLGRSDRNLSFWAAAPAKTTYSAASGVEPVAQAARDLEPRRAAATATAADTSIRPFHIRVSDEVLADRRQRIAATKWPK